jgi:hypothetical protein
MKTFFKTVLILFAFNLISCDQNDDISTTVNKFTVGTTDYDTPNAYIEFDEDNQDQINFFFTDGRMIDNVNSIASPDGGIDDYHFSVNTTNFVFINIRDVENPSIVNPYPNIQVGNTYIGGDSDSIILSDGEIISLGYFSNGFEFGYGDDTSTNTIIHAQNGNPNITINSYNFDTTTNTGTINVDYIYNGITGHYDGTIGFIFD